MNFNFVLANFHLARFYLGRFDLFYNLSIIKISLNGVGVDEGGDLYKNKSSISPNFYTPQKLRVLQSDCIPVKTCPNILCGYEIVVTKLLVTKLSV